MKKNNIVLTAEQRRELEALISAGQAPARKLTHARILLKADRGPDGPRWSARQIHEALEVGETTVHRCAVALCKEAWKPRSIAAHNRLGTRNAS